ncbi:MAG: NAD(P)/FAD-dependent oxidoreductase [Phycisphaerales bacterium]
MTVSHWRKSESLGTIRGDVIVIGGGICGLSAARALERRGLDVHVIERGTIGCGATSRNAGFLMRGAAESYARAAEVYGRETASILWRWTEENLAGLREEGIDALPSTRRVASCILAMDDAELAELEQSRAMLEQDGFEVGWIGSGGARPGGACVDSVWSGRGTSRPLAGLLNPGDAACQPMEVLRHLAFGLARPVWEDQEVVRIEGTDGSAGRGVEVVTSDGRFVAERALVCTNAYAGLLLPTLSEIILPRRGQMLAFRDDSLRLDYSYYARFGYDYVRQAADGAIVIGGCRDRFVDEEVGFEDRTTVAVQTEIERLAERLLGVKVGAGMVEERWSGTMGFTPDGLPLIDAVPGPWDKGRVWLCGGFNGHGMSMAHRAARAAVEGMLDGGRTLFAWDRVGLMK